MADTRRGDAPLPVVSGPTDLLAFLARELAPSPGRLAASLRTTALALVAVVIAETFRTPEAAVSASILFFLPAKDAGSSLLSAIMFAVGIVSMTILTIIALMASLSEPAFRVALIVCASFGAMFLSRTASLGPPFFLAGASTALCLAIFGDQVLALSLQPDTVSNATSEGIPSLFFMPPEEALTQTMLWFGFAFSIPIMLSFIGNGLAGRDPGRLLRAALAERLAVAAALLRGEPGAPGRLEGFRLEGLDGLLKMQTRASQLHPRSPRRDAAERLVLDVGRLLGLLAAWAKIAPGTPLEGAARDCDAAAYATLHDAFVDPPGSPSGDDAPDYPDARTLDARTAPLHRELVRTIAMIRAVLADRSGLRNDGVPVIVKSPRKFFTDDAFSNPDHVRFALKATLAVMICYVIMNLANFPQIRTCVVTVFLVSLGSVGESAHKARLRIAGATIGGAAGMGVILALMPAMTDIGELLALLAPLYLLSAWVAAGSERMGYAGGQAALALSLALLQGYGPTLELETARNRVIGVLLGNAVTFVVFVTIWPVDVAGLVRARMGAALETLAALVLHRPPGSDTSADAGADRLSRDFMAAVSGARALLANASHETREVAAHGPRHGVIGEETIARLQDLVVPAFLVTENPDDDWEYRRQLAEFLRRCGNWLRDGQGGGRVLAGLPPPPAGTERSSDVWCRLLDSDLRAFLEPIVPRPAAAAFASREERVLAAG